eukprot:1105596-Pelagomonas_calceolata.AAC.8
MIRDVTHKLLCWESSQAVVHACARIQAHHASASCARVRLVGCCLLRWQRLQADYFKVCEGHPVVPAGRPEAYAVQDSFCCWTTLMRCKKAFAVVGVAHKAICVCSCPPVTHLFDTCVACSKGYPMHAMRVSALRRMSAPGARAIALPGVA